MRNLDSTELAFVTKIPCILGEVVVRPLKKRIKTEAEIVNSEFAKVAQEIDSYSVSKDDAMRDMHKLAYEWSKTETETDIADVMIAYCPVRMPKKDVKAIVKNAVSI